MDLISIIIPVYNVERYVRASLDSALAQTYPNIEYIIVDDCGTDKSIAIIQELLCNHERASAVSLIHHEKNKGVGAARNTGLENAHGDYIYFMDPDDCLIPDCITLHHRAITTANADLCLANIKVEGRQTVHVKPLPAGIENCPPQLSFYKLIWNSSVCNRFYKMSIIQSHNLRFNTNLVINEDCAWNYEYVKHCKTLAVVENGTETYIYTANESSVTRQSKNVLPKLKSQLALIEMMKADYLKGAIKEEYHNDFAGFIDFYRFCGALMMLQMDKREKKTKKEIFNQIKKLSLGKSVSLYGKLLRLPYPVFTSVINPLYKWYKTR